jgi:hypothetical protein
LPGIGIRAPDGMLGIPIVWRWGCSGGVVDMPALLSSGR